MHYLDNWRNTQADDSVTATDNRRWVYDGMEQVDDDRGVTPMEHRRLQFQRPKGKRGLRIPTLQSNNPTAAVTLINSNSLAAALTGWRGKV